MAKEAGFTPLREFGMAREGTSIPFALPITRMGFSACATSDFSYKFMSELH